jgi:hypothetical protein
MIPRMAEQLPIPRPSVVFCEVEDGAVLLHVEDEIYFSLSDVAARIWRLLPPAHATLDELCSALQLQYPDVPPEVIREDVQGLLGELLESRLVTLTHASEPPQN